jgi:PAS domain S-box-containing protein
LQRYLSARSLNERLALAFGTVILSTLVAGGLVYLLAGGLTPAARLAVSGLVSLVIGSGLSVWWTRMLVRSQEGHQVLIQSILEGIVTVDEQGSIVAFNRGAEQITGWPAAEVLGQPIDRVMLLGSGKGKFLEQIPQSGAMLRLNVLTRAGADLTLSVSSAHLTDAACDGAQRVLVFRDVTEKDSAQRLRSYFLANISHEFRTPLSALKASVELLLEGINDLSREEISELLHSIHFSVTGLQTLIDNLLESVSIEAGRFRIRRRPTDLKTVVDEAERVMKPLLERRQQSLAVDMTAEMPPVNVDPMRLNQVLVNLLSNASKYGPMETPIELSVKWDADRALRVAVSDQGSGISPEERMNLFRRFVRLDEKDKAQYGIGLGLSVVKTIVEEHGGVVGLDERPGGGSVFWFTIPVDGADGRGVR